MDYRYLGRSGFRVPALSLGTATFGGKGAFFAAWGDTQAEQATRLVDMCLDFGLEPLICRCPAVPAHQDGSARACSSPPCPSK